MRNLAKRTAGLSEGTLKALGVGEKLSSANTNAVRGALLAIGQATQEDAELAPRLGLLPDDLADTQAIAYRVVRPTDN